MILVMFSRMPYETANPILPSYSFVKTVFQRDVGRDGV